METEKSPTGHSCFGGLRIDWFYNSFHQEAYL